MISVVDLFTGAGGLTFGFEYNIKNNRFVNRYFFDVKYANEINKDAAESFIMNYPNIKMLNNDIRNLDNEYFESNKLDTKNIDLVVGGPPCQSYSTIGARKNDDRANMYKEYLRVLNILKPKMFIFENVTGLLTMRYDNVNKIIDKIIQEFDSANYRISYKVLDSANYGVPQTRRRVFIVGVRKDIEEKFNFPEPLITNKSKFVSLKGAISDLPSIADVVDKNRRFDNSISKYQRLMRGKVINKTKYSNHISSTHGDRITRIINALGEGESKKHINDKVLRKELPQDLYLTSGYYNSYGRLWWDKPCVTLTNNFSSPSSFRCIHPLENRSLSTREGARIQSFPDDFIFVGSRTSKNNQIGNAVPPILSVYLANSIEEFFIEIERGNKYG